MYLLITLKSSALRRHSALNTERVRKANYSDDCRLHEHRWFINGFNLRIMTTTAETSFKEQQEDEMQVLRALYETDLCDLREKDAWKVKTGKK